MDDGRDPAAGKAMPAAKIPGMLAVLGSILLVLALWPSFGSMLDQWDTSTYSYGYLIVPVALFLLWRDRGRLAGLTLHPSALPALLVIPIALGWVVAVLLRIDVGHQLGAVALLLLMIWALIGTPAARRLWFPLAYLFFMVPAGDSLIPYLMDLTANATVKAVRVSGVPVYQDGYVFSLPSGNFEVVEACSGVRFLMAALIAGAAFAYLEFRHAWQRILFLLACAVVGILGNVLRAYSVVMIAHLSDMRYGQNHQTFGIVLNGVVLLLFFFAASRYADPPDNPAPGSAPAVAPRPGLLHYYLPALFVVLVASVAGWLPQSLAARAEGSPAGQQRLDLPAVVPRWEPVTSESSPDWQPEFPSARVQRIERFGSVNGPADVVDVAIAEFAAVGEAADLTSSVNRMSVAPWSQLSAREAGSGAAARREVTIQSPARQRRIIWWWYRVGKVMTTSAVQAEWLTLRALLSGSIPTRGIIAISTPVRTTAAEAAATLADFSLAAGLQPGGMP